jgi:ribonuclease J
MIVRPSVLEFISRIEAPKGNFINSMYQLYETYDENRALINWVKEKGYTYHHIHTSGHATLEELKAITAEVNPKHIIPIHTENKNIYANHFDNIVVLNDNQPFTL